jgi:endoglucanase
VHVPKLPAGSQTLALAADTGGWNLNNFSIATNSTCTSGCSTGTVVEAESFAQMSGIQTESTSDSGGGLNVGWIDAGDWMTYNINLPVSSSGLYDVSYRVASMNGGGLKLEQPGGGHVYGTRSIDATGGWQNWTTVTHRVSISAGTSQLAIAATAGGWNINWIEIKAVN